MYKYSYEDLPGVISTKLMLTGLNDRVEVMDDIGKDEFKQILFNIGLIYNTEPEYFLLGNVTSCNVLGTAYNLVNQYRFEYNDDVIRQICNDYIEKFNFLSNMSMDDIINRLNNYYNREQIRRGLEFTDASDMIESLFFDYMLLANCTYQEDPELSEDANDWAFSLLYGSSNYLLSYGGDKDLELMNAIKIQLNEIFDHTRNRRLRKCAKVLKRSFPKTQENE